MFALVAFSLHPPTTSIYVRTATKKKLNLKMNLIIAMSKGEQEQQAERAENVEEKKKITIAKRLPGSWSW